MELNKKMELISTFDIKAVPSADSSSNDNTGSESIYIEGYANNSAQGPDRAGDVIIPNAWDLKSYLMNPIVLFNHDYEEPIGTVEKAEVTDKGLYVRARISSAAEKVYNLIKDGVLKAFSVGFRINTAEYDPETEIFTITGAELLELSVVSVPCNQQSVFSLAKSLSEDELTNIKKEYSVTVDIEKLKEELRSELLAELSNKQAPVEAPKVDTSAIEKMLQEKLEGIKKSIDEQPKATVTSVSEGTDRLLQDVEKKIKDQFEAKEKSLSDALESLRSDLQEKASEIEAMKKNKMQFMDRGAQQVDAKELDRAIMVAKVLGRPLNETRVGRSVIEKANAYLPTHPIDGANSNWEVDFATRMVNEMRPQLVVEPLFNSINMPYSTMRMPVNPDVNDTATWVSSSDWKGANSTGSAVTHELKEVVLNSYKVVSKEYIGYEEEEDLLIPIIDIVRGAILRRMAVATDKAVLRGTAQAGDPIKGLTTLAADGSNDSITLDISDGAKVTSSTLQSVRKNLGIYGLNPQDVIFLISQDAYYDLLTDTNMLTVDKYGVSNATILTGEVMTFANSRIIVSQNFEAKASGKPCVVAVYTRNFLVGEHRSMLVERDRLIEQQKNILVASRRIGFAPMILNTSGYALGVATAKWVA